MISMPGAQPAPKGGLGSFVLSVIGFIAAILCLPVVLLAGGPIEGWLLGVALWAVNWGAALWLGKVSQDMSAPYAVGLSGASFIARAWIVDIDDRDGPLREPICKRLQTLSACQRRCHKNTRHKKPQYNPLLRYAFPHINLLSC